MTVHGVRESLGSLLGEQTGQKRKIKVIGWGAGASAFYPKEVLERDGAAAFPKGTKIYFNHPTREEEWDRPERDVKEIAGKFESDAWYEDGSLFADVYFGKEAVSLIDQYADVLGMSIYAMGESEFGTVGDYTGEILTHFAAAGDPNMHSCDIVTAAGARGAILEKLTESAIKAGFVEKPSAASVQEKETKGLTMDEETKAAFAALTTLISGLVESKQESAKVEVEASIVSEAVKSGVEAFAERSKLIAEADILESQKEALLERATFGEDIADELEKAIKIAAEAKETFGKGEQRQETGRLGETASNADFSIGGWN